MVRVRMWAETVVVVGLLAGPPVWLAHTGWPLAGRDVGWAQIWVYVRSAALPADVLLAALAAVLAAAWAAHLALVLADAAAVLRGAAPRLAPLRLLAALLAGTGVAATAAPAAAPAAAEQVEEYDPQALHHEQAAGVQAHDPAPPSEPSAVLVDRERTIAGFAFDSADLTPDMRLALDSSIDLLEHFAAPDAPVAVTGHTDPVGDADYNLALSQRRADAAADYLTERLGEGVEVTTHGAGDSRPRGDHGLGHAGERRIELTYTLASPGAPDRGEAAAEADAAAPEDSPQGETSAPSAGQGESRPDLATGILLGGTALVGIGAGYAAGRPRRTPRSEPEPRPPLRRGAGGHDPSGEEARAEGEQADTPAHASAVGEAPAPLGEGEDAIAAADDWFAPLGAPAPAAEQPEAHGAPAAAAGLDACGEGAPPGAPGGQVRLRLFAPHPALCRPDGQEITAGLRTSARLLLAVLALRPAGVGAEEIDELLSGESPSHAKAVRNAAASSARKAIREAIGDPGAPVVISHAGRYQLQADIFSADVWDLDRGLKAARTTSGEEKKEALRAAIEAYHQTLLSETDLAWIEPQRWEYARRAAGIAMELADLYPGAPEEEFLWLEKACEYDPHNEIIYHRLMRLYASRGRIERVQQTYETLHRKLQEAGAAPSSATRELVEELTSIRPAGPRKAPR